MIAERESGNYALLKYTEPNGDRRLVVSYVIEETASQDVYRAFTDPDAAARWCDVTSPGDGAGLTLLLPEAPGALSLVRARPMDQLEFAVAHPGGEPSTVIFSIAPAERQTVLVASHRHLPVEHERVWSAFWCGPMFLRLGDLLRRGGAAARPTIVQVR
ncbi:hypothetical protein GCM10009682_20130 [Luedemannella flava]|uniref:Activator of Hsp90 ATPase homologue 1/2-like C-terminal domain-containing protein n=1 Tax=Luedemannella flava TaxID=349316 RepID=A0ABP4Y3J2_9ACTN